jgi:transcriptional regulator with XRE-family HTH domain
MAAEPELGPATRRRQLGRELRKLRLAAGLKTIKSAAERTGLSTATISRIEAAKQAITPKNVRLMGQAYGVGAPLLDTLVRLAGESDDRGWLVAYSDTVPDWFERFVGEEADARTIWNFELKVIPGLLQTEAYTRAVSVASNPRATEDDLRQSIAFRRARQERLLAANSPELVAVIDESALHRVVGSPEVMREQLRHLIEVSTHPNITVLVLPFSAGAHPAKTSFAVLHFMPEGGEPTVFVEVEGGALYPDRVTDFDRYTWIFHQLEQLALSAENTCALLSRLVGE